MSIDLIERWVALCGDDTRAIGADLVARYGEPHRRHHTRDHLTVVLDLVDEPAAYADDPGATSPPS